MLQLLQPTFQRGLLFHGWPTVVIFTLILEARLSLRLLVEAVAKTIYAAFSEHIWIDTAGCKVFPNEGVTELHDDIERIKHSVVFAMDELQAVYDCDGVDKTNFPTIGDLKKALVGYTTSDGLVAIQDEPIVYDIPKDMLDVVNSHYDGKDLMAALGGMLHQKYPDQEYRKQRCIEIYGKLI